MPSADGTNVEAERAVLVDRALAQPRSGPRPHRPGRETFVTERDHPVGDDTLKFGLLMESAQAHQKLAETHLTKLLAHTQGLDDVVRDEIRRTLIEEFQALSAETDRAAAAMLAMKRAANLRAIAWNLGMAVLCTVIPGAIAHFAWPSKSEITGLRAERDALAYNLAELERRGGKVDWRECGSTARLCVRIDRKAPVYGKKGEEYLVVDGY
jgi:hypothetical protein